jgi:hypothetical protein
MRLDAHGEAAAHLVNPSNCSECGAALASDQRYCLSCGERLASARPPFAAPGQELSSGGRAPAARMPGGMPPPRSAAILVIAVLGLGLLIGGLGASSSSSLASARPTILVSAPQAAAPSASSDASALEDAGSAAAPAEEQAPAGEEPASEPTQEAPAQPQEQPEQPESDQTPADTGPTLPEVHHVFVIALSGQGYTAAFGPTSPATYLTQTLVPKGELLPHYYATAHADLPNYIALISGQPINPQTQYDCPNYVDVSDSGDGCVYGADVKTIADQLAGDGLTWKAYIGDMGNGAAGTPTTCRHPANGAPDDTLQPRQGDLYATRHNPFVYFHSITDTPDCDVSDVGLESLEADLASAETAANYSFIAPPPGDLAADDAFLKTWVPKILKSPAYKEDGLLAIVFDQGTPYDTRSCCGQEKDKGGGRAGALLLSPFVRAGSVNKKGFNHFSLLASIEDLFSLEHLGEADNADLPVFDQHTYKATAATARVSQNRHRLFTKRGSRGVEDGHHRTTRGGMN